MSTTRPSTSMPSAPVTGRAPGVAAGSHNERREPWPRPLPWPHTAVLAVLVVVGAGYGLLADGAYRLVPELVEATWRAQDAVTLVTVPVLLAAIWRARRGSLRAHVVAVGVLTWLTYAYAHLALGAPFNAVFLVYVAILGLAGFGMLDGLLRTDAGAAARAFVLAPWRPAA